jgi:hypothetical protein
MHVRLCLALSVASTSTARLLSQALDTEGCRGFPFLGPTERYLYRFFIGFFDCACNEAPVAVVIGLSFVGLKRGRN